MFSQTRRISTSASHNSHLVISSEMHEKNPKLKHRIQNRYSQEYFERVESYASI